MCEVGKKFKNIEFYNDQMRKPMEDKMFFIKHIPNDAYTFVDFGCADGTMLNCLCDVYGDEYKNHTFIGYDISECMINIAKSNFHGKIDTDINFYNNWAEVVEKLKGDEKKKVLILSSVIHEIYSYGTNASIVQFWADTVLSDLFDYIVIRDMCPSVDINRKSTEKLINAIYNAEPFNEQLVSFEERWGTILDNKNAIHFLLKYRYKINWEREVNENYFPITVEDLLTTITFKGPYTTMYLNRFTVPFIQEQVKNDFGVEIPDFTHIKAIFIRRKI